MFAGRFSSGLRMFAGRFYAGMNKSGGVVLSAFYDCLIPRVGGGGSLYGSL